MTAALLAGVAAGYAIAIPVGAIAAYLLTLGAQQGWRTAAGGGLGAALVDGLYAAVAVFVGALVAPAIATVAEPLRWGSAVVLVGLALWLLRPARPDGPAAAVTRTSPGRAFATVFALTLVNPATVIYFAALVAGSTISATAGAAERAVFVLGALAASASWQLLLAGAGATLGRFLSGPRGRRWTAVLGGTAVLLLALRTALGA
ncbi:LysE family transporter [Georgenia thermotolerans]|uniref:Lysine transporter LysE n=2 Tax=Georgenia thermotolerans TaxID=527326 RepID=A0A7J5UT71_9MICO|nr:LysE family transporter [Georgenia thermotolerans]KAE8765491.1 lysine transporter LysE [Georgenia thermotolerans]